MNESNESLTNKKIKGSDSRSAASSPVSCLTPDEDEQTEENRFSLICKESTKDGSAKESVSLADPAKDLAKDDTGKDEEKVEPSTLTINDSAELKIVTETEDISSSSHKRDTKEKASD